MERTASAFLKAHHGGHCFLMTIDEINADRFWAKVDRRGPNECWLWTAARDSRGYGVFKVGKKNQYAHRVSVVLSGGHFCSDAPIGMHSCDTPACVNPAHVTPATMSDNTQDMLKKGRHIVPLGEQVCTSKLSEKDVRHIHASTESQRVLASRFNISRALVRGIKSEIKWKHLFTN